MTRRTSEVATCCSSDSERSSVRWRSSLSSRVFSMAMTAWAAKLLTSSICLSVNGRTSWRYIVNRANEFAVLEHRYRKESSRTRSFRRGQQFVGAGFTDVRIIGLEIGNMNKLLVVIARPSGLKGNSRLRCRCKSTMPAVHHRSNRSKASASRRNRCRI